MSKFLIVPGLPKSGTTFIYDQLCAIKDNFNLPSEKKEVDYFRRGVDYNEYTSLFSDQDDNKTYLDASPLYADDIITTFSRINQCLRGHDIAVIFCIRNPFERMYSHYLHDVAQNFHIMGQAAHSILMPSVISRYLYPTTARVQKLLEYYGHDNVQGFSFTNEHSSSEALIRSFANLDNMWSFDYSRNSAPGFTSPKAYYSKSKDLQIAINGKNHLLQAGHLLIANRQFSALHRNISPKIAENILEAQCLISRSFDALDLGTQACNMIWDDFENSLDLLGLTPPEKTLEFNSHVSDELPAHIGDQLEYVGSVNDTVSGIYQNPLRSTGQAILNCASDQNSLSAHMAKLERAAQGKDPEGITAQFYLQSIIDRFGPSPYYTELLIKNLLKCGQSDKVIEFLMQYPKGRGLFRPLTTANYIENFRGHINDDDYRTICNIV